MNELPLETSSLKPDSSSNEQWTNNPGSDPSPTNDKVPPHALNYFMRNRFFRSVIWSMIGWGLVLGPMLLIAAWWLAPNMLGGFLLLRTQGPYLWDLGCLTAVGLFVSAFGMAQIRIYDLYALYQFGYEQVPDHVHDPSEKRRTDWVWWQHDSTAWPIAIWMIWLIAGCSLPIASIWFTSSDIEEIRKSVLSIPAKSQLLQDHHVSWLFGIGCIILGVFAVSFVLLTLSLVQLLFMNRVPSACGLLPLEDFAARILELVFGKKENGARGQISGAAPNHISANQVHKRSWRVDFFGPGFFFRNKDGHLRLLPGHKQLIVLLIFAVITYWSLFDHSYRTSGWTSTTFPVGVYALLLLCIAGSVSSWIFFIVGRIQFRLVTLVFLSTLLGLIGYRTIHYGYFVDANRYFEIGPSTLAGDEKRSARVKRSNESTFMAVTRARSALSDVPSESSTSDLTPDDQPIETNRLRLREVYRNWNFPEGPDHKKTMVVINASGGGIQAAAWTAKVLARMDEQCPKFSESIGLISGVSGGSVGSMFYLGHRGLRINPKPDTSDSNGSLTYSLLTEEQRRRIERDASASALEAVGWGLAFPDLVKSIPVISNIVRQEDDRGLALESQWWSHMGTRECDALAMRDLRIKDLVAWTNAGFVPPIMFNATTVESGQRMMISTFNAGRIYGPRVKTPPTFEHCTSPIDFFCFYEPLFVNKSHVNPRVSTAARLSASFAYVTPVIRPILRQDMLIPRPKDSSEIEADEYELLMRRGNYHLCDGGYSDNTGLVATIRVITDMIDDYINNHEEPPFNRILFVSIESFPDNKIEVENDAAGLSSGLFGPLTAIFNARVATQAERGGLELDVLLRSEDTTWSEQSTAEMMAVFDAPAIHRIDRNADQVLTAISNSKLSDDDKNYANDLISPLKKTLKILLENSKNGTASSNFLRDVESKARSVLGEERTYWMETVKPALDDSSALVAFLDETQKTLKVELGNSQPRNVESVPMAASRKMDFKLEFAAVQFRFNPSEANPQVSLPTSDAADALGATSIEHGVAIDDEYSIKKVATSNSRDSITKQSELTKGKNDLTKSKTAKDKVKKVKQDVSIPNPPLSWMLSPYDRYRIEVAWEYQLALLRAEPDSQKMSDTDELVIDQSTAEDVADGIPRAAATGSNKPERSTAKKPRIVMPPSNLRDILEFDKDRK